MATPCARRSLGILLVSAAALSLEVSLTRLFSVALWYHFAFMIVSFALLGYGASGSALSAFPRLLPEDTDAAAARLALLFALASTAALGAVCLVPLDPFELTKDPASLLGLGIYYLAIIPPFFLAGLCVGLCLCRLPEDAAVLYGMNLAGSGLGALMAVFAIPAFSNAGAVALSALTASLAALLFAWRASRALKTAACLAALAAAALVPSAKSLFSPRIAKSKMMSALIEEFGVRPRLTRWSTFAQIDVFDREPGEDNGWAYAPGVSPRAPAPARQALITVDADAATPITRWDGGAAPAFLSYLPSSIAYQLGAPARVCVIGAGGGIDVLTALAHAPRARITAVEINPDIVSVLRGGYREFSGSLYSRPGVDVVVDDGRHFMAASPDRFDVIQVSLVDTWAAASSGAYGLTENYLYTTEAFEDYLRHLGAGGLFSVTRWLLEPPKEALRLAAMAHAALRRLGVPRPEGHIAVVRGGKVATLLVKESAFTGGDVKDLAAACARRGFEVLYAPGLARDNDFSRFLGSSDKEAFYASYPTPFAPATDDRPFFFHFNSMSRRDWGWVSIDRNNASSLILWAALAQAALLSTALILGPLAALKRGSATGRTLGYFAAVGIGFMFVEIPLAQGFILFLGNPTRSLSVILFSLMTFSGLGSLASARIKRGARQLLPALTALIGAYALLLPRLPGVLFGVPGPARLALCVLLLAPPAFLMGMPFPLGLRAARSSPGLSAWAWGVNGCFSVAGSILGVILAMSFGFQCVLGLAAAAYALAWALSTPS